MTHRRAAVVRLADGPDAELRQGVQQIVDGPFAHARHAVEPITPVPRATSAVRKRIVVPELADEQRACRAAPRRVSDCARRPHPSHARSVVVFPAAIRTYHDEWVFRRTATLGCPLLISSETEDSQEWLSY